MNPKLFFVFYLMVQFAETAKILFVSPNLSNSMVMYTGRMADVLVRAGHEVTFFIPEISSRNLMNGTKLAKVVRLSGLGPAFDEFMASGGDPFSPQETSILTRRAEIMALVTQCEEILKRFPEFSWLSNEGFDLAIADNLDLCDISLIRALKIPTHIWTTTGPIHDIAAQMIGIPTETSYVPTSWDNFVGPIMNFRERLNNLIRIYSDRLLTAELNFRITRLFRKYVSSDFPDAADVAAKSALLFVNGDEFVDPIRPVPSKVVTIGGVGLSNPPPLRGDFMEMAAKGERGFVLFSLGGALPTVAVSMETKRQILKAFAQFPEYHFIVKADRNDEIFRNLSLNTANVDIVGWMPQNSLLAHPNARVFITHGGYNSVLEAGRSGVPMLVIPLFFDQLSNAKAVEYRHIGRALSPQTFNDRTLRDELSVLLVDPSYKSSAERIAQLSRTKPNQPDETLVRWVEFVLTNGELPELRPELLGLSFIQYNYLDVLAISLILLFAVQKLATKSFLLFGVLSLRFEAKKRT